MDRTHNNDVDVLFVNPPSPDQFIYIRDINRHGRSSWERMIWPQTNLAILAAVAEEVGLKVDVIDCMAENISWSEYYEILKKTNPRYCFSNLISVTYRNDVMALNLAKKVSNAITVGMGPHITDSPERSLQEVTDLDFAIRSEAEQTLKELLEVYESGIEITKSVLTDIDGIAFISSRLIKGADNKVVVTKKRELIKDLDSLPIARHDLLPLEKYWAPFLGNYTCIETSRGCPYKCTYCRQGIMYNWNYRTRSGKSLAKEALHLYSLGVKGVLFHADTFTVGSNMVEELCEELIKAGSPIKWACNTHANPLSKKPGLIKKMKQAGCWMMAIGIESGDDQILENIKKSTTTAILEKVIRKIDAAGIQVWGYFVIGFPGETKQTIEKTIKFANSLPLSIAKFDIGAPYPGTEFGKFVTEKGYIQIQDYEDFDQNASAVVSYPDLSAAEIKAGVKRATRKFYLRPHIMFNLIKQACDLRSITTLILIARDHFNLLSKGKRSRKNQHSEKILQMLTNE